MKYLLIILFLWGCTKFEPAQVKAPRLKSGTVTTDFFNNPITDGARDIGAIEYQGAYVPPPPPLPPPPLPPPPPTIYYSIQASGTAIKNDCPKSYQGTKVTYIVPAGTYSSMISQAVADDLAIADVNQNKQAHANANGVCVKKGRKK